MSVGSLIYHQRSNLTFSMRCHPAKMTLLSPTKLSCFELFVKKIHLLMFRINFFAKHIKMRKNLISQAKTNVKFYYFWREKNILSFVDFVDYTSADYPIWIPHHVCGRFRSRRRKLCRLNLCEYK